MLETIRLFKAVPITRGRSLLNVDVFETYRKTMPKGFVLAPSVVASYNDIDTLIKTVDAECGLDPNYLNKAFHKSFGKVKSAPMEQLFLEQMAHYLTTYGAERFGVFDVDRVYIPVEDLDVPAIDVSSFEFVVIRGLTVSEIKSELLDLLRTGAALSEQTVKDCLAVASMVNLTRDEIEQVRNREVKIGLYDAYNLTPSDPVEFLRYVIYRLTGDTLLIKNAAAVAAIKESVTSTNVWPLFHIYSNEYSLNRLGEIFLRFKPLFLAMRAAPQMRPVINKIRRAAERNHKPMPEDYLNGVTAAIQRPGLVVFDNLGFGKHHKTIGGFDFDRLARELDNPNVNIFRKIRLANALSVRADRSLDSIVYKIRNGKSFATTFDTLDESGVANAARAYDVVMSSIADSIHIKVAGKRVYIPEGVIYGLPATEKQFTGNIPAGTSVRIPSDQALVAGVYWEDQGSARIDLDLSLSNLWGKIGWDGSYRSAGGDVLFSGDNTSAPNGASEVFWVGPRAEGSWMLNVNYYNRYAEIPVPFKIVVGTADASQIDRNFVFDPNRLLASASAVIDVDQMNLGIIAADADGSHQFFFSSSEAGGGRTSRYSAHDEHARKFMMATLRNAPTLNEVLSYAGAEFVDDPSKADEGFNLSTQAIDKSTFLSILAS